MILAGDLVPAGTTLVSPAVKFFVWENTTRKELQTLELTSFCFGDARTSINKFNQALLALKT